jgi:HEAT repeat protein
MFSAPLALALATLAQQPAAQPKEAPLLARQPRLAARGKGRLKEIFVPPPPPAATGTPSLLASVPPGGDENVLKNLKIDPADAGLLNFFKKRTPPAPAQEDMAALIKKLSSPKAAEADAAQGELICIGQGAVPVLRQAANNVDDVAGSARARTALAAIEGADAPALAINAARLIAVRKPAGATAVLLGYLPYADSDDVFNEVEAALVTNAVKGGKADPALLRALKDRAALRRGAAAHVLCQAGGTAHHEAVRPLLKDSRVSVKLRAALGLVTAYDSEAIPVLIDLLGDLNPRQRREAEAFLTKLAGEWAVRGPMGNDKLSRDLRRDIWKTWWKGADGDRLLEEFTSRTMSDGEREKAVAFIAKLSSTSADARSAAVEGLIDMGKKVTPLLRRAVRTEDPQVSPLATRCLEAIEKDSPNPMPTAAPRLLGLRRPRGTVEALIGYLPFTETEEATHQVIEVLGAVGVVGGKADKALVNALESTVPIRRAGAAAALCRGHATDHLPAVRGLLKDKESDVRRRTALALAGIGDKSSVPVLIALLGDLPVEQAFEIEDYLHLVAGDKGPTVGVGPDKASRAAAIKAWKGWWKENSKGIDLARVDLSRREHGYTLVVENYNPATNNGRVLEIDSAGKVRFEIKGIYYPYDAKVMRNGNVLLVESNGNRVVERDKSGREVWGRFYNGSFSVQPLRNGNVFIACRNQLLEATREGKLVVNRFVGGNQVLAAKRFRDGSIAYVDYGGNYYRLDRTGKQVKTMRLPWFNFSLNGAEILPGDRVVVSVSNFNKVIEFDGTGRQVWECAVTAPLTPFRLSNGHTLVASNFNMQITEIDRSGKIVKEMKGLTYRPFRVSRR